MLAAHRNWRLGVASCALCCQRDATVWAREGHGHRRKVSGRSALDPSAGRPRYRAWHRNICAAQHRTLGQKSHGINRPLSCDITCTLSHLTEQTGSRSGATAPSRRALQCSRWLVKAWQGSLHCIQAAMPANSDCTSSNGFPPLKSTIRS